MSTRSVTIACGKVTQAPQRQTNCDFIPARYTLTSSFQLLLSVPRTIVIQHSIWETPGNHFTKGKAMILNNGSSAMTPTLSHSSGCISAQSFNLRMNWSSCTCTAQAKQSCYSNSVWKNRLPGFSKDRGIRKFNFCQDGRYPK